MTVEVKSANIGGLYFSATVIKTCIDWACSSGKGGVVGLWEGVFGSGTRDNMI